MQSYQSVEKEKPFLCIAKDVQSVQSAYRSIPSNVRTGIILFPADSKCPQSDADKCYKARVYIDGKDIGNVDMGEQTLPKKEFLTFDNDKQLYCELINKAFRYVGEDARIPQYIRDHLARADISHMQYERAVDAQHQKQDNAANQEAVRQCLAGDFDQLEKDAATDKVILELYAKDLEERDKKEAPSHPLEHKNPSSSQTTRTDAANQVASDVTRDKKETPLEDKDPGSARTSWVIQSSNTQGTVKAPQDVVKIILDYCGLENVIGGRASVPLVSTLFNSIKPQKMARLKELLTAIVNGNLESIEKLLKKDSSLLLEKLDEDDYVTALSGQKSNNVTAYRTALAVEDSQMALLLRNKLLELTGNNDVANAQYREQFPDGWEAYEAKRWAPVSTTLDTLTTVIGDAKPGDITSSGDPEYKLTVREGSKVAKILAHFRSQLDALLNEVVTTGRHFNPNLLLKAFQIYNDHFRDYFGDDWSDPRAMLFWQQVIGTIQRRLPVNYVQAFCDGLSRTEEKLRNNQPQGRSLKIDLFNSQQQSWVPTDFYPLAASRLGFDYAIFGRLEGEGRKGGSRRSVERFRSLCQSKTVCMQTFVPHQSQNVRRRCCSTFCSVM